MTQLILCRGGDPEFVGLEESCLQHFSLVQSVVKNPKTTGDLASNFRQHSTLTRVIYSVEQDVCPFTEADLVSCLLLLPNLTLLVLNFPGSLSVAERLSEEGCTATMVAWERDHVPLEQRVALVSVLARRVACTCAC